MGEAVDLESARRSSVLPLAPYDLRKPDYRDHSYVAATGTHFAPNVFNRLLAKEGRFEVAECLLVDENLDASGEALLIPLEEASFGLVIRDGTP